MIIRYIYKVIKIVLLKFSFILSWFITCTKFLLNGVLFDTSFKSRGVPIVSVSLKGKLSIGENFMMHSGKFYNMIGRQQQCYFIVERHGVVTIGKNVGISCTAIVCHNKIIIGDNVRIGGGSVIYDTDFHSIYIDERLANPENINLVKTAPVIINDGAFIGAHTIVLKGVSIGSNSVIGAGSVVTKSIPDNEVWAGNPARFVKSL